MSNIGYFQDDLEPTAGLSSAAACIRLSIPTGLNDRPDTRKSHYTFAPTFTHQCFDVEYIRGYEPTEAAKEMSMMQANIQRQKTFTTSDLNNTELGHISFRHHARATHQLALTIHISPSCRQSAILIITQPKEKNTRFPLNEVHTTKNKKRSRNHVKVDTIHPDTSTLSQSSFSSSTASVSSSSSSSQEGRTRHGRMPMDEIISKILKATPTPRYVSQDDWGDQSKTVIPVSHPLVPSSSPERISVFSPKKKLARTNDIHNLPTKLDDPIEINASSFDEPNFEIDEGEENILRIVENDYLDEVMGTVISTYSVPIRSVNGLDCSITCPYVSVRHNDAVGEFIMTLADGNDPKVKEYHDQVQKLSLWFIENADGVNVSSTEGGGSWKVLYLFRKHRISSESCPKAPPTSPAVISTPEKNKTTTVSKISPFQSIISPARRIIHDTFASIGLRRMTDKETEDTKAREPTNQVVMPRYRYSLVGYMTLFCFSSPFKKPKGGIIQRVCQVVILPPYQRAGHGKKMLQAVYDYARNSRLPSLITPFQAEIVEINVEDPAPAFVALRDSVDYQLIRDNCVDVLSGQDERSSFKGSITPIIPIKYLDPEYMEPLLIADATQAATIAKITPRQVQIAYEIYKLDIVLKRKAQHIKTDSTTSERNESDDRKETDTEKKWNIMVKKRLNISHKEIIGSCSTREAKKAKLSQIFDETVERYRSILGIK